MAIKTTRPLKEDEIKSIKGLFQNLGIYINRMAIVVKDAKFPISVSRSIRYKVNTLYLLLEAMIEDVQYVRDERDTLLRALDTLNPAQFQALYIIIQKYWTTADFNA